MDDGYILKNGIVDKYIVGDLLDEDKIGFEEHLLYCEKCREEVRDKEIILLTIKKAIDGNKKQKRKVSYVYKLLAAAASIILLIGSWTYLSISYNYKEKVKTLEAQNSELIHSIDLIKAESELRFKETLNAPIIDTVFITVDKTRKVLASNFSSNSTLENLAGQIFRGSDLEITSNIPNTGVFDTLKLAWNSSQEIDIAIFNNRNEELTKYKKPYSPKSLTNNLPEGKHYILFLNQEGAIQHIIPIISWQSRFVF